MLPQTLKKCVLVRAKSPSLSQWLDSKFWTADGMWVKMDNILKTYCVMELDYGYNWVLYFCMPLRYHIAVDGMTLQDLKSPQ